VNAHGIVVFRSSIAVAPHVMTQDDGSVGIFRQAREPCDLVWARCILEEFLVYSVMDDWGFAQLRSIRHPPGFWRAPR